MLRDELDRYLNDFMGVSRFDDASVNGLQVEGGETVERVALAVSACAEAFTRATAAGAQALIVHHGLLWRSGSPAPLRGLLARRVRQLLQADLSLFAYHLPLDAHPEVGNNAVALRELGCTELTPFGEHHGRLLGWRGVLPRPVSRAALVAQLEAYYRHPAWLLPCGPEQIRSVGLVSGGAASDADQAADAGLDLYLTGEFSEPVTFLCRERGLNFAALGHHATEVVGVRALGEHLRAALGLETVFVELDNPA